MYHLLSALKKIIERKVVNIQTLHQNISAGDTTIVLKSAKRFDPCDIIVIYREGEEEAELRKIEHIHDYRTIEVDNPITDNYDVSNTYVQNVVAGEQWIKGIYIGDPPVIPRYPAITIHGNSRSSEWLTLDSTKERFEVSITIYIQAQFYDKGYRFVLELTKKIEDCLFHTFYPLVEPYCDTVLLADVTETDTVILVEHDDLHREFAWFFVESDKFTRPARPKEYRENGVIELMMPIGVPFSAGDDVIFPGRHFYDTRAESTDYGYMSKEKALLWGSRISYYAIEEVLRADPNFLPIDRR